jgi:IS4 transposase
MGGFFLSRIKAGTVIHIKTIIQGLSSKKYVGISLLSIKNRRKKGDIIDVMVEKILQNQSILTCRAIGFWNPAEKKYHWYLTNLSARPSLIYSLYRFRWQIELMFKSCKQSLHACRFTTNDSNIIESLMLTVLISTLVSQAILQSALPYLSKTEQLALSYQRVAKVFAQLYSHFRLFLLYPQKHFFHSLVSNIKLFSNELFDPNYLHRPTTFTQIYQLLEEHL